MPIRAKVLIGVMVVTGLWSILVATQYPGCQDWLRFVLYLGIALVGSGMKVRLPGIEGTMSVNFLFLLIGIVQLSLPETLIMALSAATVQSIWKQKSPTLAQTTFNFSMIASSVTVSYLVYHRLISFSHGIAVPLALVAVGIVFFVTNTVPVAMIIGITENKPIRKIWSECYFWSFPHYLVGAAIAGFFGMVSRTAGWQETLLIFPIGYFIYRSYRLYIERLEAEKTHVEDMASLHLRTIEALALAIEAKDHTTHDHLYRVRKYALKLAKDLAIKPEELEALRAAALLHDIGKLAVPEHIINKPGRLTPEEFDKMKIHPLVGAEILKRVNFPYPVVPIVEAHHEKWDGSGYPYGLSGEEIPIGARILAVVDCLDALASDRQYRRALPMPEAFQYVCEGSGTHFDPIVIETLKKHSGELLSAAENDLDSASSNPLFKATVTPNVKAAPAAGYDAEEESTGDTGFLSSIAAARQEAQTLFELSHELGNSLSVHETLSLLSLRLGKLIPYQSIAIYVRENNILKPQHVSGENFRLLSSLEIPIGRGISGWVAAHGKPILNGSPAVEWSYAANVHNTVEMKSALSVPLTGLSGIVGVLTVYRTAPDAFTRDHLRVLLAISSKVALCIDNAMRYQKAESSATTDYLTGLPNARSLFLHLDQELSRCKRESTRLAVMVCDLDGFKQINDRFGHLEGNKVLRVFAQELRDSCREYDYVARMGGDEFVLVIPGLDLATAKQKAIRINELGEESGYRICGERLLSVSVGSALYPEHGTDAEQLLAAADHQMYLQKQRHTDQKAALIEFPARRVQ